METDPSRVGSRRGRDGIHRHGIPAMSPAVSGDTAGFSPSSAVAILRAVRFRVDRAGPGDASDNGFAEINCRFGDRGRRRIHSLTPAG